MSFNVGKHNGIEIPETALIYRSKDTVVRIVQDGRIKEIVVTLGEIRKGYVEILTGLKEKDTIVIHSSSFLTEGTEVSINKESINAK